MQHKTAMLLSGAITAFVLMVVIGLVYGANRFGASAAPATPSPSAQVAPDNPRSNSAEVATLQAQIQQYRSELQQAYSDLQAAYNQINAQNSAQAQGGGTRRFGGGEREHEFSGKPPLNQPSFGQGSDD